MDDDNNINNSREDVLKNNVPKGMKRKVQNKEGWKRNIAKKNRIQGKDYVSLTSGKLIKKKQFIFLRACCSEKCAEHFSRHEQQNLFDSFYDFQSKECQDVYLSGCLTLKSEVKRRVVEPKLKKEHFWEFYLKQNACPVKVCRKFLLSLFQISQKRIRVLQNKVVSGASFEEKRGKTPNSKKIAVKVYELAMEHLKSIPHRPSHYAGSKSNRLYFDNPDLNIKEIFNEFSNNYFPEKTNSKLDMKYKTYFKFFRQTHFTFKPVKTDTCDFCNECAVKLESNPNDECRGPYEAHRKKAERFYELKKEYIEKAKSEESSCLVIEFDFAQNLPLPKLTVTKQFYKRLLWLYVFNAHVQNDDSSFFYTMLESTAKKGANSVVSFIFDCINKKANEMTNLKEIIFLSDAAGGQNKNKTMMMFSSWAAKTFNVDITHVYPIRGHSFGQCDRNFGLLKSSLKKKEVIEVPDVYYSKIVECRNQPTAFELKINIDILDWEDALKSHFFKSPQSSRNTFTLQKFSKLKYKTDGSIVAFQSYGNLVCTPCRFMKRHPEEIQLTTAKRVPLKAAKVKDLKDLFIYLKEDSKVFYQKFLEGLFQDDSNETDSLNGDINEDLDLAND